MPDNIAVQPVELSHTRINDLECPFRFDKLYRDKFDEPDTEFSGPGRLLHIAAANYGLHLAARKRPRHWGWYYKMLAGIIEENAHLTSGQVLDIQDMGYQFAERADWTIDHRADRHIFEERMYLDREYVKVSPQVRADRLAGTADHIAEYGGGAKAAIEDFKYGRVIGVLEYDTAQHDKQLQMYAGIWCCLNPKCDEVVGTLFAPRFGPKNKSTGTWTRAQAIELMKERVEPAWGKVDALRAEYGEAPWPWAAGEANKGDHSPCNYCRLTKQCGGCNDLLQRYREAA